MGGNSTKITARQWITVAILCFVNLINYMDRFTIAGESSFFSTMHDLALESKEFPSSLILQLWLWFSLKVTLSIDDSIVAFFRVGFVFG
jgi:hypothetical protein